MTGSGIRIGRLFGISIRVDWSWLLIFLLVTWNLSAAFGTLHTDWSTGLRWGVAVIASLLFFGSVLAHELAHSLVARSHGMKVRSITLFLFGGVSSIQEEPPSPSTEFLMAVVGPLTSIVIGVVIVLVADFVLQPVSMAGGTEGLVASLGPVATVVLWLGSINVLLGLFNLVPGFPLDGGRLLRSALWSATGNLRRATRWASWTGQAIAWAMIIVGIMMIFGVQFPVLGTGFLGGLWLAFIGWFLNSAAEQSYRQVVIQDVLQGVPVERLMRRDPPTTSPDSTVSALVHDHIMRSDDQAFPVMRNSHLVGMVTLEDVRKVGRDAWEMTTVEQIMTPADQLESVTPEDDAADAMMALARRDVRQLPVLEGRRLVGLLRRQDIVKWLQMSSEI